MLSYVMDAKARAVIARTITERREALGMKQRELAEMMGVSERQAIRWGQGSSLPDDLLALASALGLSLPDLLEGADEEGSSRLHRVAARAQYAQAGLEAMTDRIAELERRELERRESLVMRRLDAVVGELAALTETVQGLKDAVERSVGESACRYRRENA